MVTGTWITGLLKAKVALIHGLLCCRALCRLIAVINHIYSPDKVAKQTTVMFANAASNYAWQVGAYQGTLCSVRARRKQGLCNRRWSDICFLFHRSCRSLIATPRMYDCVHGVQ
jgi:hypothetical protein